MSSRTMHLTHPKYRSDIDGLRAIAILSVIGFHAFPNVFPGGFIGVDIFFVISGYLISTILFDSIEKGSFSFIEFYARRIRRIFPALIVVLIASFCVGWFLLLVGDLKQLVKHIAGGAGFISNFVLWSDAGYFDTAAETKPLLHLWSLGIEEQFYIAWPLLLWAAWKLRLNLLIITLVIAAASFTINVMEVNTNAVAAFYSPQTRFWELLCGSILSWLTLYRQNCFSSTKNGCNKWLKKVIFIQEEPHIIGILRNIQSLLGLLLILWGIYTINKGMHFPGAWALFPTIGTALIISADKHTWVNRYIFSNRVMVWVGLISYPLYLWHWPMLAFARIEANGTPSVEVRIAIVLIAPLLAWLTYIYLEKPFRLGKNGKLKAMALLVMMSVIGLASYSLYKLDDFNLHYPVLRYPESTYPAVKRLFLPIDFKWHEYIRFNKCHLQADDDLIIKLDYDKACRESRRPLVALWGDSNASALYPGLKELQDTTVNKFGLTQLTAGGCPPVFNADEFVDTKNCSEINKSAINKLQLDQPDVIILDSVYMKPGYSWSPEILLTKFSRTLDLLKERLPNSKIILIGPVPQWGTSPQMTTYFYWKKLIDKTKAIPVLQKANLLTSIDLSLKELAHSKNAKFISVIDTLCTGSRCISSVGSAPTDFIATDATHFSKAGAEYFIEKVKDEILSEIIRFK